VSTHLMLGQPGQVSGTLGGNPWNTQSRRGGIATVARKHQTTLLALGVGVPAMMLLACLAISAGKRGLAALEGLSNGHAAIAQSTSESKEAKNLDTARAAIVHAHGGQPIDGRDGFNPPAGNSPSVPASEQTGTPVAASGATRKRVLLVIAHDGFWYADYEPVRRILEQGGIEVRVASSREGIATPDPASGGAPVETDTSIQEARAHQFDAIVFTGGGMQEFIGVGPAGATTRSLVEEMAATNKWITSLCGGNAIPAKLGVLRGHKAAANQYIPQELQEGQGIDWVWNQPVVLSGRVLTGQSFEYAEQFAQELLRQLLTSA
jgi:putative intracellular protease/amidase